MIWWEKWVIEWGGSDRQKAKREEILREIKQALRETHNKGNGVGQLERKRKERRDCGQSTVIWWEKWVRE